MSKSTVRIGLLILTIIVIVGFIWVFPADDSFTRIRSKGVIRIGYAVEAPYAFIEDGVVTGESPELARLAVSNMGNFRIEWRQTEFGLLISELNAGQIDVIAAGMFISPQRAMAVNFSEPTFHVQQNLLVKKNNPKDIHSYEQALSDRAIKIAVLSGSFEEHLLKDIGLSKAQIIIVPDALTGKVSVESGLADGLALSSPTIHWIVSQDQKGIFDVADPFTQPKPNLPEPAGYGAFAFRKEDKKLLEAWNASLDMIIGDSDHLKILKKFGFSESELPGRLTTGEILSQYE